MINLKEKLYFSKLYLLYDRGIKSGKITPFSEEFYEELNKFYFGNIPIGMQIKYLKPTLPPGKCYDRSLFMFFCFPNSLLVRGDNKDLEYRFGKDSAGHGWIEMDGYVYDPSMMMKIDKDLYYKMYEVSNVRKCTKEEYDEANGNYYDEVRNVTIDDFKKGGEKRYELVLTVPLIKGIADNHPDKKFKLELDKFLESIEYDDEEVYNEFNDRFERVFCKKMV